MGLKHFQKFMCAYADEYGNTIEKLEELGDHLYLMGQNRRFERWLKENRDFRARTISEMPQPTTIIRTISNADQTLPLYAIALHEFFYDELSYVDENNQIIPKKQGFVSQQYVADMIHVSRSLVTSWKNGTRSPGKYEWWALGICMFDLDYQLLRPYMHMIGATVDLSHRDDMALYYAMCAELSVPTIYTLLKQLECDETAALFAPPTNGHRM